MYGTERQGIRIPRTLYAGNHAQALLSISRCSESEPQSSVFTVRVVRRRINHTPMRAHHLFYSVLCRDRAVSRFTTPYLQSRHVRPSAHIRRNRQHATRIPIYQIGPHLGTSLPHTCHSHRYATLRSTTHTHPVLPIRNPAWTPKNGRNSAPTPQPYLQSIPRPAHNPCSDATGPYVLSAGKARPQRPRNLALRRARSGIATWVLLFADWVGARCTRVEGGWWDRVGWLGRWGARREDARERERGAGEGAGAWHTMCWG